LNRKKNATGKNVGNGPDTEEFPHQVRRRKYEKKNGIRIVPQKYPVRVRKKKTWYGSRRTVEMGKKGGREA